MVELVEDNVFGMKTIDSYGIGGFRVQGELHFGNIFIFEDHLQIWNNISELIPIIEADRSIDFLIFGTGAVLYHSDNQLLELSRNLSIGVECLDTPSACRLFNMLSLEGRKVGGVLGKVKN